MERQGRIIAVDEATGGFGALPACYSIGVSEFTRWLARAKAGADLVYAHGSRLAGKRDVCVAAREAQARGDVQLLSVRQSSGVFLYIARRVAAERAGQESGAAKSAALPHYHARGPGDEAGQVLAMLSICAEAGKPCPTNREIAVALRIRDARRVRYLVDRLMRDGVIAVETRGQRITRVVTITATGQRTSEARTGVGLGFEKIGSREFSR